jgi:hypothetical protein
LNHAAPAGALQAAVSVVRENATYPGSIGKMVEPIVPAVLKAQGQAGDLLDNAVRENVRRTVNRLRTAEALLVDALKAGKLKIVGARYDLDDGSVGFFDEGWERTDLLLLKRRSASTDAGGDLACALHSGQTSPFTLPVPLQSGHRFSPVPGVPGSASSPGFAASVLAILSSLAGKKERASA